MRAELVDSAPAPTLAVSALLLNDEVELARLVVALLCVWPVALSSASVRLFSASIRVLRLGLALEVESTLPAVAADELVVDVPDEALASCNEVRKASASDENRSDGPPPGGGPGGGPERLAGPWELVEVVACPVWSALFAAVVRRLASSA